MTENFRFLKFGDYAVLYEFRVPLNVPGLQRWLSQTNPGSADSLGIYGDQENSRERYLGTSSAMPEMLLTRCWSRMMPRFM